MLHQIASQIGQTENDGGVLSPAVMGYLAAAGIGPDAYGSVASWSGALLTWAAIKSGLVPPVSGIDPLRWLDWGGALAGPQPGCVVILTEGAGRSALLCGVAARIQARKVYVIGAFDRSVQTRAFPIEQVISARRVPASGLIAGTTQLTIEHEPVPSSYAAPAPLPLPAFVDHQPSVDQPLRQPPPDAGNAVTLHHLEAMLSLVQDKFRQVESRIDTVQNHAIGAITITEIQSP